MLPRGRTGESAFDVGVGLVEASEDGSDAVGSELAVTRFGSRAGQLGCVFHAGLGSEIVVATTVEFSFSAVTACWRVLSFPSLAFAIPGSSTRP